MVESFISLHFDLYDNMKRFFLLATALMFFIPAVTAQVTDNYRPAGFDYNGASIKTFSVSDTSAVQFSRGNLQYNAAQNKWRFALRQYYSACNDNNNIAEDYDGWIDLFGWGTSGWNSGATAYQPWSTSTTSLDYQPGGSYENSLTGAYSNADWGIYNKIENGGKFAGMWRTLTKDEWEYLVGSNTKRNGKNGLATIGGIHKGLLLLPDEWTLPSGCSFTAGFANGYATNQYTYAQWEKMQSAGAVFMQAAGYRFDTEVYEVGGYGGYWSSTCGSESDAWEAYFGEGDLGVTNNSRYDGRSVRLVRRVQTPLVKHGWVDMGLPSGTLWYSCNVGTTKPQSYGAYFAWGETRPKAVYGWSNYAYGTSENTLTKYCQIADNGLDGFEDTLIVLQLGDDAARIAHGGDARTPTQSEFLELIDNCTRGWSKYNGVNGYMLTSNTNGNRLFFPAAGNRLGAELIEPGEVGFYRCSSLDTEHPSYAWILYFGSDEYTLSRGMRALGYSVRAVKGGTHTNEAFDENGASIKTFTVAEGRTVHFSKGNLWYNAYANLWRFAPEQFQYIGDANTNISETYSGYIDLFGWGTSGWNSGANAYHPWDTSSTNSDYYPGGSYTNNLTGEYADADWGVHNPISNGGNRVGMWRTLTKDEWDYLLQTRNASTVGGRANARYALATINGTAGVIILPDSFTMPTGVTELGDINTERSYTTNVYTTADWTKLEAAGAIFLPAAGIRDGVGMHLAGAYGKYWSSTHDDENYAWGINFNVDGLGVGNYYRSYAFAVRLVKE